MAGSVYLLTALYQPLLLKVMVETPTKPPSRLIASSAEVAYRLPEFERQTSPWQRLLVGATCLGLGLIALSIGFGSLTYRLTHTTIDNGLVTGRLVRVQAPIDGELKEFFASSGVEVRSGQVLARVAPGSQQQQTLLQLQGDVAAKTAQITAARQSLDLLNQQLQSLQGQELTIQAVNAAIAANGVDHDKAAVDAAIAIETAAQTNYQRYQQLLDEGVVSRQRVDELRAEWQAAQAAVRQARADLNTAHTSLGAARDGVTLNTGASSQEQRMSIMQLVQSQTALINTLSAQLATSQQQLKQAQSLYSDRRDVEVAAPFNGVIYSTEREAGEQVNRPDVLLTLLDCNDLWVETLVSAEQASKIDVQQPVRVQLAGESDTFLGEVELIEAISRAELVKDQAQALTPSVPSELVGEPLSRVVVRIPPTTAQEQAHQVCGVGQSARLTFSTKFFGR
jgi:membrane fusion protein, multidrug efflux system